MNYSMRTIKIRLGLWELAVLALLREHAMHPYEMKRLLRERHKEQLLGLNRGSLYHAVARLTRAKLIETAATSRPGRRPERTTYRVTAEGDRQLMDSLRSMVATPRREPSEFLTCLSFLVHLKPQEAINQLEERTQRLRQELESLDELMSSVMTRVSRINLLESEYLRAMRQAELEWIEKIIRQIHSGELRWDFFKIQKQIWGQSNQRRR